MKMTLGQLKRMLAEVAGGHELTADEVRAQFPVAWETAMDAGGPAGDETEREECAWSVVGGALHAHMLGLDPSTGSKWTPETGWVPNRGWAD